MNKLRLLLSFCCALITCTAYSQLKFNLKSMPDADTYGVYVKPCGDIAPSAITITGSAQVTIVLPLGNDIYNMTGYGGIWQENATVSAPDEAPDKNYISFGFLSDNPQIVLEAGKETLLFTFELNAGAPVVPQLLDNELDPFAVFPNSVNSNPGNEMSVLDVGTSPVGYYYYTGNYTDGDDLSCTTTIDTTEVEPTDTTGNNENPTATLDKILDEKYFVISPNPASHQIEVDFLGKENISPGKVRLWTTNGIVIGEKERNGQQRVKWKVSDLPAGLYFLSYESGGQVLQRERFMKY